MAKSSEISTTNQQIPNNTSTSKAITPKTETKFKIDKNLSWNPKNVVYIIECIECEEIYIGSTEALNAKIKIEENRKLNVSKHLNRCSRGKFKIMPIYQTNDYTLL